MRTILLISPYWKEQHRWMVSTVKLAELWQRIGYRVVVACMGAETSTEDVSSTLRIYRRKDVFLPDPWNYGIALGFSGFVQQIIRDEKPDLIVVNKILFWSSLCVLSLRLRGHKVLLLTDALVGMTWWGRTFLFRLASRLYAWTLGWAIMLAANRIVFFHPQPDSLLRVLGVKEKSQVIPTGIDVTRYSLARFSMSSSERATSNEQPFDLTQDRRANVIVSYIGRLESVKGVDDFLAAIVPLKQKYPQMTVQVIGWYKDDHPLVAQYQRDVVFTGLRKDIPEILAQTDIFVMPSHSEGLSNAIMEAMASGCATVATDVGGNAFLIQNGISGFLFPVGDREALAAHIRRLIDDPAKRKAIGENARKRIETQFSWEVVGKMYGQLFQEMQK